MQTDYAKKRLEFAVTLFYKLIENLVNNEKRISKDISALVQNVAFYECVLACSLEIVIYSYNCQRKFPWILEALEIQPYNFVKVIELVVRSKDQFSRDAVKHLNLVSIYFLFYCMLILINKNHGRALNLHDNKL